jgi:hypothetical protein
MWQVEEGGAVDIRTLNQIVDCMTRGQYQKIASLFGADVGRSLSDEEPMSIEDLPPFYNGQ